MPKGIREPLQELEGGKGFGGVGGGSGVGGQFKNLSPLQQRAEEKTRDASSKMTKEERRELMDTYGKQFKGQQGEAKKSGGVISASRRGDGVAQRGKTRGRFV